MSATEPTKRSAQGAVRWLTAQTVSFGLTAAFVGVVANAMFLDAYGSTWLPVTYIVIGAAGVAVSAGIARGSRRYDLVPIAVTVLGAMTMAFVAAWVIARGGSGDWVSGPLLVVFAVLIQLGFVFVGMQAGRVLDIAGIKASMPRIMAGFPIGAIAGGLLAAPLISWLGSTEALLLPTALAQASFTALVWATGRRYASVLSRPPVRVTAPPATADESPRRRGIVALLATRFVALILGYQVLSALGSQLVDFLVMDRAAARYETSEELARFVAQYTAVMNIVIIAFLATLAGPLMRRYGLRLGILANPLVVTVLAVVMIVVLGISGGASLALLLTVSAARILDLALSDGTTRTSVNAMYQVLPPSSRIEAQATVEGMGVPLAIGLSGVVIILINLLPSPLPVMIVTTAVVCLGWTLAAVALYRSYRPALVDALKRRPVLDPGARLEATVEDGVAARRLLTSGDAGSVRLGLELAASMGESSARGELAVLARDPRTEVRLAALSAMAAAGDEAATSTLTREVPRASSSEDPVTRRGAALALPALPDAVRVPLVVALCSDDDPSVRVAAIGAVSGPVDALALPLVVSALRDPLTAAAASVAVGRLGDAALPAMDAALSGGDPAGARRLVAAVARSVERDRVLTAHIRHEDAVVGLTVLRALAGPGPATEGASEAVGLAVADDVARAVRVLEATVALEEGDDVPGPERLPDADRALLRALTDELRLLTHRVGAALAVAHGTDALEGALGVLRGGEGDTGVAVEMLEVLVGPGASTPIVALLDPRLGPGERLAGLRGHGPGGESAAGLDRALQALVEAGPGRRAPTPWLRACSVGAAGRRGPLAEWDLSAARALGDPVVDEQLAANL